MTGRGRREPLLARERGMGIPRSWRGVGIRGGAHSGGSIQRPDRGWRPRLSGRAVPAVVAADALEATRRRRARSRTSATDDAANTTFDGLVRKASTVPFDAALDEGGQVSRSHT